ncbi:hypothetical protein ABK040_011455 [Willaertia magna]
MSTASDSNKNNCETSCNLLPTTTTSSQQLIVKKIKTEFTEELHYEMLDCFINPIDGFNYLLTFVNDFNLISLYVNHHRLFKIVCNYQKFNQWYNIYGKTIFEINKNNNGDNVNLGELIPFQWNNYLNNCKDDNKKDESGDTTVNSINTKKKRKVETSQNLLQNTKKEILLDLKEIKKEMEKIVDINIDKYFEKKIKYKEWKIFLNKIAKKYNPNLANDLYTKIFKKIKILKAKVDRIDYHYQYEATIKIDQLILIHSAYDDEGCDPHWSLNFCDKETYNDSNDNPYFNRFSGRRRNIVETLCEMSNSTLKIYSERMKKVKRYLDINEMIGSNDDNVVVIDNVELNRMIMDCLIHALPWRWQYNAVFYGSSLQKRKKKI